MPEANNNNADNQDHVFTKQFHSGTLKVKVIGIVSYFQSAVNVFLLSDAELFHLHCSVKRDLDHLRKAELTFL